MFTYDEPNVWCLAANQDPVRKPADRLIIIITTPQANNGQHTSRKNSVVIYSDDLLK